MMIDNDSEVTVAVMGATGSGKTTFINLASGSDLQVGRGLQSCTNIVQVAQPFMLNGRSVTLIDTPGFDDNIKSDSDILRMIALFLATAYENDKKLSGVIYIHRISDIRMGGTSTRNFKMFRHLCGDNNLQNMAIVTNMWGEVTLEIGEARETELASQDLFFKPALDKGALFLRHENTRESAHAILQHIIQNHPLPLQIQRELVDEKKDISQTAAVVELNKELMLQIEKHRREMQALQEEMKEAIRVQDKETRDELEAATQKLQGEVKVLQTDVQQFASEYKEDKHRLETTMQEMAESARLEVEQAVAKHARDLDEIRTQLNRMGSDSSVAQDHEALISQMKELEAPKPLPAPKFFAMIGNAIPKVFNITLFLMQAFAAWKGYQAQTPIEELFKS